MSDTDAGKVAVVREICAAWSAQDWDRVVALFAPDGVLRSMMSSPVVGRDAFAERVRVLARGLERIDIRILAIGVVDGRVFVERVDDFDSNGNHCELPVVGILRVEDGLVTEWLDYYDRASLLRGMGLTKDFAH